MQRITVEISDEGADELWRLADERGVTPEQLLASFARDLAGAAGNPGGDERGLARDWLRRVVWPRNPGIEG